jgi:hypothetical protein
LALNESLAQRIRAVLAEDGVDFREQKMFGGVAFMVADRFACGALNDDVVLRIGREAAAEALSRPGVRPMDFTGRVMAGWVYVEASAVSDSAALAAWVRQGVTFSAMQKPARRSRKASQVAAVYPRRSGPKRRA